MMSTNEDLKNCEKENILNYANFLFGSHQDDWSPECFTGSTSKNAQKFVFHCILPEPGVDAKLDKVAKNIGYSLKVYLSIVVMELKFKNQLLYFLKAVMKHLS